MLAELLSRTPSILELSVDEARIVGALRFWVAAARQGRCPLAAAAGRLGSRSAGAHLHLLLEEIGAAWPEAFLVSPPCCSKLSPDEALVAQMISATSSGDRPAFDRLLCDMLPAEVRDRLFLSTTVLSASLEP